MASYYVRSGAAGAGTGADWANAFTTLAAAYSGKAAGDVFYVSEDHAETQGSAMTLTSPGSQAAPALVYCVDHAGTVPPVSADLRTTATITTTGASAMNFGNTTYYYGIIFSAGSGAVNSIIQIFAAGSGIMRFDNCSLRKLGTTANGAALTVGGTALGKVILNNTTVQFGNATDGFRLLATDLVWKNTPSAILGATPPSSLFSSTNGTNAFRAEITGVDLSAITPGPIFAVQAATGKTILADCKIASGVTIATTPNSRQGPTTDLIRADSGATNYRTERYWYEGTQTVETTIVRTGGATDGTTPIAWKLVTTANSKWVMPFESLPIAIWNDGTSAITVTVYGIWGGGAVPLNDEIWIEAEYLGAAGTPQGSFVNSSKADNLATGANTTADSSTWGGSTTKFKMSVTFTPAMKGPINLVVKAAKASSTFYIDPRPEISGVMVSKSAILTPGVYANELSTATVLPIYNLGI